MKKKLKKTDNAVSTSQEQENAEAMRKRANITLKPSVNAAIVVDEYSKVFGKQDLLVLVESLSSHISEVTSGNMEQCEAMLLGQAHALQSIFMTLSRQAAKQEYLNNFETYLRLALKAQNQCRTTLETLATIKNPPIVYAKQANIAQGPQQINNNLSGANLTEVTRAKKNKPEQNEVLEVQHEQRLDSRTAETPSRNDSKLETVAAVNRPEK